MQSITDTIDQLHLGTPTTFAGLSVFPLFGDMPREADYITLDEALRLSADELAGGALVVEDRVVHLAAFNRDPDGKIVRPYPSQWSSGE